MQGFIQALTDLRLPEVKTQSLNWVLKLNPLNQKKNCLDCLERALFFFFTLMSHQGCKYSVQKERLQSTERNVCVRQTSFSAIILLNKIMALIF